LDDVDRVHVFNWRLRSEAPVQRLGHKVSFNIRNDPPSTTPHVDTSETSIVERVRSELPNEAEFLLRGRFRHINLWRPLTDPVTSFPLAVTDGTSIDSSSLVDVRHIQKGSMSTTTFMTHHEGIRWYYQSMQSQDDLLIFKNYDSDSSVVRGCPHAAVPMRSADGRLRESIEVRAFVFTYPPSTIDDL